MQVNLKYVVIVMGAVIVLLLIYIMILHMKLILSQTKSSDKPIVINNYTGNQSQPSSISQPQSKAMNILPQSSFFTDSINFAEQFVRGNVSYDGNIPLNQSAQKTINALNVFNDQIKNNIITAINYYAVDSANSMNNEAKLRQMAQAEKTPLWIIILREAMGKVVPSMNSADQRFNPNLVTDNTQTPTGTIPNFLTKN